MNAIENSSIGNVNLRLVLLCKSTCEISSMNSYGAPARRCLGGSMSSYQRAVPVLQVVNVEKSLRWYMDVLGFAPNTFPDKPPYSFAILRRDEAEIMLQCSAEAQEERQPGRTPDPEFLWSIYLRIAKTAILDVATAVEKKTQLLRGPEKMFYGLVEFELSDPDGYRICVGGDAPAGANVKVRQE